MTSCVTEVYYKSCLQQNQLPMLELINYTVLENY
jgi:hypothetical protein